MFDLKIYEEKMEKAIDVLKREFSGLRTGRASTSLLDPISVEAYLASVGFYAWSRSGLGAHADSEAIGPANDCTDRLPGDARDEIRRSLDPGHDRKDSYWHIQAQMH